MTAAALELTRGRWQADAYQQGTWTVVLSAAPGVVIGTVDQGSAGTAAWLVSASSLPLPDNAAKEEGGNLDQIAVVLGQSTAIAIQNLRTNLAQISAGFVPIEIPSFLGA